MDTKTLQALIVDALEDVKAQDIRVFDTTHLTSMFDRIVVASGTSNRQTRALAMAVRDKVKSAGGTVISVEGEGTGEWVLVDLGDAVVHIMQPAIRAYYRLEELWGDKEIKLGAAKKAPAKKVSVKTSTASNASGKKTASKIASKTAIKTPAKTAAKSGIRSGTRPATKAPLQKVTAKKTPAKQSAVKPARKTAATKSAPRR